MADINPLHQIDQMLADITAQVADPLQTAQDPDHIQHPADTARVFHHVGN